jgi:hypothetical protein
MNLSFLENEMRNGFHRKLAPPQPATHLIGSRTRGATTVDDCPQFCDSAREAG